MAKGTFLNFGGPVKKLKAYRPATPVARDQKPPEPVAVPVDPENPRDPRGKGVYA